MEGDSAKKSMLSFLSGSWPDFVQSLFLLSRIGHRVGKIEKIGDTTTTFWSGVVFLAGIVQASIQVRDLALMPVQKAILSLLDQKKIKNFLESFSNIESALTSVKNDKEKINKYNVSPSKDFDLLLERLDMTAVVKERWVEQYEFLSQEQRNNIDVMAQQINPVLQEMIFQFHSIVVVLGVAVPPIHVYSLQEVLGFQTQGGVYEHLRMARTIFELMHSEDKTEFARIVIHFFVKADFSGREAYTWEEVFFLTLFVHAAYVAFPYLAQEYQKAILQTYFYRALLLGVPVRDILSQTLYATDTPVSYITLNCICEEGLSVNAEFLDLEDPKGNKRVWRSLVADFVGRSNGQWDDTVQQERFLLETYRNHPFAKQIVMHLGEAFSIYFHLKNADLIEKNEGGQLTEGDKWRNDLLLLLAWFGIGRGGAELLVNYFSQEHPRVSLTAFLNKLKEIADLQNEVTVENCVEVGQVLREQHLLDADQELVVFDERKREFQWALNVI